MFARGGVNPFSGGALAAFWAAQANEQATAGRIAHVADQPIAAVAAAVGEIMAAHRLGLARETTRQF